MTIEIKKIRHELIGEPRHIGSLCLKQFRFDKLLINRDSKYEALKEAPFSQYLFVISKGRGYKQQSIWLAPDDIRDLKNLLDEDSDEFSGGEGGGDYE